MKPLALVALLFVPGFANAQIPTCSSSNGEPCFWPDGRPMESGGAPPGEDRSWHLLQKQYDGLIRSVQHGLTKYECEFAAARVMGLPATDEEKTEAKRKSDEREAKAEAARVKWLAEHPKCTGTIKDYEKGAAPECNDTFGTGRMIGWGSYAPTNIHSAECFQ